MAVDTVKVKKENDGVTEGDDFQWRPLKGEARKSKKKKKRYYNQDQSKSDSHNKSLKEIIRLHGTNFIQTRFRLY